MHASVGIHHPKGPDEEKVLLGNMRQLGEAMKKHSELIVTLAAKDLEAGMLIGIAVWKSKEDFESRVERAFNQSAEAERNSRPSLRGLRNRAT